MKAKLFKVLVTVLLIGLLFVGCSKSSSEDGSAAKTSGPKNYKIASMTVGGSWYIYAVTIAEIAKAALPEGNTFEVLPYQGGVGNPILVGQGDAQLGLSFSVTQNWAYNGIVEYKDNKVDNIRAILGGLSRPFRIGVCVREASGITSMKQAIEEKRKIRLLTVQMGGLGEAMARQVLEAYGASYEDIKKWGGTVNHIDLNIAVQQMQDGQADVFIHNISFKQPDITEMMLRGGLTFIDIDPVQREYLCKTYGHLNNVIIEANEFVGVKRNVTSIGYPSGIIANTDMDDDTAYAITKAVCENLDTLKAAHASLLDFDPTKAGDEAINGYIPLHPGAERYFREKGYIK